MSKHTVYTPEPGAKGELGRVMFYNGQAEMDSDQHEAELRYAKAAGYTIEPAWPAVDEAAEVEVDGAPETLPKRSASAAEWRKFAVEQGGLSRDDADSLTRDELAAHFYGNEESK